jgi:hypothetical protein
MSENEIRVLNFKTIKTVGIVEQVMEVGMKICIQMPSSHALPYLQSHNMLSFLLKFI